MIAVTADVLTVLGGLVMDDPAVMFQAHRRAVPVAWHPAHLTSAWWAEFNSVILLPTSAAAMGRVLVRHLPDADDPEAGEPAWVQRGVEDEHGLVSIELWQPGRYASTYEWYRQQVPGIRGDDLMVCFAAVLVHVAAQARGSDGD